jgi:hypothetical protein
VQRLTGAVGRDERLVVDAVDDRFDGQVRQGM